MTAEQLCESIHCEYRGADGHYYLYMPPVGAVYRTESKRDLAMFKAEMQARILLSSDLQATINEINGVPVGG